MMQMTTTSAPLLRFRLLCSLLLIGLVTFLSLTVAKQPQQLQSLGGYVTIVLLLFLFSKHPSKVLQKSLAVTSFSADILARLITI